MTGNERIKEKYRQYNLLAALHDGKYKGRAWKDKQLVIELESDSVESALNSLKNQIDKTYSAKIKARGRATPKVKEYIKALQAILPSLNDNQLAMLKAHYKAPKRTITATQLAQAVNYKTYSAANLHYGKIGFLLNEILCMDLPKYEDGTPIATYAIASGIPSTSDMDEDDFNEILELINEVEEWHWVMRPELAEAIEYLGLNN